MTKTNPCNRWKMNQIESRHEELYRIQEDILGTRGRGIPPMMAPNMPTPETPDDSDVKGVACDTASWDIRLYATR